MLHTDFPARPDRSWGIDSLVVVGANIPADRSFLVLGLVGVGVGMGVGGGEEGWVGPYLISLRSSTFLGLLDTFSGCCALLPGLFLYACCWVFIPYQQKKKHKSYLAKLFDANGNGHIYVCVCLESGSVGDAFRILDPCFPWPRTVNVAH